MGRPGALHRCADLPPAPAAGTGSVQAALYPDGVGCGLRLRAGWPAAVKGGPGWHPLLPRSFFARTLLLVLLTLLFSKILTLLYLISNEVCWWTASTAMAPPCWCMPTGPAGRRPVRTWKS